MLPPNRKSLYIFSLYIQGQMSDFFYTFKVFVFYSARKLDPQWVQIFLDVNT